MGFYESANESTNESTKRRGFSWNMCYSSIKSIPAVEKTIGVSMNTLHSTAVSVQEMLALARHSPPRAGTNEGEDLFGRVKHKVFKAILRYFLIEGYVPRTEVNTSDLVLLIIFPIIEGFIRKTSHEVKLEREMKTVPEDSEIGGYGEEFIVIDAVTLSQQQYVFIIESKKESLVAAMNQCLLALKNMGDCNREGVVYGFITTGLVWRMLRYDPSRGQFLITDRFKVAFDTMARHKEDWMSSCSVIVNCIYAALSSGIKGASECMDGRDICSGLDS